MKRDLYSILAVVWVLACNNAPTLEDYYYPVDNLMEGMVYEYHSPLQDGVQHPPYYWYYRKVVGEDGTEALVGVFYNHELEIEQMVRERVVTNGVKTEDVRLYEYDAQGTRYDIQAEIKEGTAFLFEADESKVLPYILTWRSKTDPDASTILTRGRAFRGFTKCDFKEKKYDCAVFEIGDKIEADHDTEGGQVLEWTATEHYAKGVGLVYSKKTIPQVGEIEYELVARYPMTELEKKFKKILEKE